MAMIEFKWREFAMPLRDPTTRLVVALEVTAAAGSGSRFTTAVYGAHRADAKARRPRSILHLPTLMSYLRGSSRPAWSRRNSG